MADIIKELFEKASLNEMTYKDLKNAIDPRQLPHKDYAPLIKRVNYVGMKNGTAKFFIPNKYNGWNTYINFKSYRHVTNDPTLNATDASRLLVWASDIRCYCGCPSFKFHGYAYILTQLDAAIFPENRFPKKMNPNLKNVACKHLRRTILVLPFHVSELAKSISQARLGNNRVEPSKPPNLEPVTD